MYCAPDSDFDYLQIVPKIETARAKIAAAGDEKADEIVAVGMRKRDRASMEEIQASCRAIDIAIGSTLLCFIAHGSCDGAQPLHVYLAEMYFGRLR